MSQVITDTLKRKEQASQWASLFARACALPEVASVEEATIVADLALTDAHACGVFAIEDETNGKKTETEEAKSETKVHKFASTQFNLEDAAWSRDEDPLPKIRHMSRQIAADDLAEDGREDHPHITIKYGLHTDNPDDVSEVVKDFGPVQIVLGKTFIFPGDEYDVVNVEVQSPQLVRLNKLISESLECTNTHPKYVPHICLAYVKSGLGEKYVGIDRVDGMRLTFQDLIFSDKRREKVDCRLSLESVNAKFAWDIENRKAQGILNRTIELSKKLARSARIDLEKSLATADPAELSRALLAFIQKYRVQLADLLTTTQLASLLEGAREVARDIPVVPMFPSALPPATLEPRQAVELIDRLKLLDTPAREEAIYNLPADQQRFARQGILAQQQGGEQPPTQFIPAPPASGVPERIHYPIIDEAARELSTKNVMTRAQFDQLQSAARQKAFTIAYVESLDTMTKIRDVMAETVRDGVDVQTFRERVLEAVDEGTFLSDAHMETVYRTNVQTAFSDGQMAVLKHPFVQSGFPYASIEPIDDDRARHNHVALATLGIQGTNIYRIDDPVFQLFRAPWDFNCFLPGTEVQGNFVLGLKSWYSGEVIEITTRSGKRLAVTANHPVLTVQGFAPANSIYEGQELLSYEGRIEDRLDPHGWRVPGVVPPWADKPRLSSPDENKHDTPAVIEKVFGALGNFLTDARMPVRPDDFHGDARFGDGYVDVVGPLWELLLDQQADFAKACSDLGFSAMHGDKVSVPRPRSFDLALHVARLASDAGVSLSKSASPSGGIHSRPLRSFCFGLAANIDASRYKTTVQNASRKSGLSGQLQEGHAVDVLPDQIVNARNSNDELRLSSQFDSIGVCAEPNSGATKDAVQAWLADADFLAQLRDRFASDVAVDPVVHIRKYNWSGHVYDLQSVGGFIVANNIFCSNCRCSWIPMTIRQAAREGIEEAKTWMETGVEPIEKAFVPMPSFRPPPGFVRSLSGAPLSIRLACESLLDAAFNVLDASGYEHKGKGDGGGQFASSGDDVSSEEGKSAHDFTDHAAVAKKFNSHVHKVHKQLRDGEITNEEAIVALGKSYNWIKNGTSREVRKTLTGVKQSLAQQDRRDIYKYIREQLMDDLEVFEEAIATRANAPLDDLDRENRGYSIKDVENFLAKIHENIAWAKRRAETGKSLSVADNDINESLFASYKESLEAML